MPSPFGPSVSSTPQPQGLPAITSMGRRPRVRNIDIIKLALWALAAAIGLGVAATRGVVAQLDEARRDLYLHNAGTIPARVVLDGATTHDIAPGQWILLRAEPGPHSVQATLADGRVDVGRFEVPPQLHPFQRYRAVYDVSGVGRYVVVTARYGGGPTDAEALLPTGRLRVFPDDAAGHLDQVLPRHVRAGTHRVVRRVCVELAGGTIPCAL